MRRVSVLLALPLAGAVVLPAPQAAAVPGGGLTARLSLGPASAETNGPASAPAVADNGHVAYVTYATGLGFTDANDDSDVVVSTAPGVNVLVSRTTGGTAANAASDAPAISADGRYVAFRSDATDLGGVSDTNNASDVYLLDRDPSDDGLDGADRTLTRVSTTNGGGQANGASDQPALAVTPQGVFVAFRSTATNLAAPDRNKVADVFVKNVGTGAVTRVSVGAGGAEANGPSASPAVGGTATELVVAFESLADNLALPDDGNAVSDVYARVVGATSSTELISRTYQDVLANGASYDPSITADGAKVAFTSDATNMVANDTNGWTDVFLRARPGQVTLGISGNGRTDSPALSGDGRALVARTFAANVAPPDTNGLRDVVIRDLVNNTVVRSSAGNALEAADGRSEQPAVSALGEYVAFRSDATNLAPDTNGVGDVFRRRRDVVAPTAPVLGGDATGVWSTDATVDVTLSASDPAGGVQSGLDGYGVVWDSSPTTTPIAKTHEESVTAIASPTRSTGSSHYVHVRAVDNEGNWGPVTHRGPFWVDTSEPQVSLTIDGNSSSYVLMKSTSTPLTITATDTGSGLDTTGFKIYYERARYDRATAGYEARVLWRTSTATSHTFTGVVGYTYHFVVERRDKVGNLGSTADSSFINGYAVYPADDTSAAQVTDAAWTTVTSSSYYGGEAQRSTTSGSYLRLPVKYAKEVGVLATNCDGCGSIQLYVNGAAIGSAISLDPAGTTTTTHNKVHSRNVLSGGSGYLDVKVTTSGKPVVISGIVIRR